MGAVRIEIYKKQDRRDANPGDTSDAMPAQIATETSTTTATTAGSRIVVAGPTSYAWLTARVVVDEACYLAMGLDPTAAADAAGTGTSWLLAAGVAREFRVKNGWKFSFKDVA